MMLQNSGKVVLVVEDNEQNMVLVRDLLEVHGHTVLQATNGMEGWRSACEHIPDLIIMDIQLPDCTGLDITRKLKDDESLKSIPIIAVTAFAMTGDKEKILEGGCDGYIAKPISVPEFLQVIDRHLAEEDASLTECARSTA